MIKHNTCLVKELIRHECEDIALHIRAESLVNEVEGAIDKVTNELTEYAIDELKHQIELAKKMTEEEIREWLIASLAKEMSAVL